MPQPSLVQIDIENGIAVLTLDNPPVNAASHGMRAALLDAINQAGADPAVTALVLIGAGNTFVAGSDLAEFGRPIALPDLPSIIAAIEALPKPVLAAIHGAALGGGFELALGCDARIATPEAVVGLPEVTLGIIPGAGGTQRLPRLVGVAKAMELIVGGTRVPAQEALTLGLIDAIAQGELRQTAIAAAAKLTGKSLVSARVVPSEHAEDIAATVATLQKKGRGRASVRHAIETVHQAATIPFAEALRIERDIFQHLRLGEEARALRHLFFAERAAQKIASDGHLANAVESVGIAGAGTMGIGIATAFAAAAYQVTVFDTSAEVRERAKTLVSKALAEQSRQGSVVFSAELDAIAKADLVIEAVFEDMGVKSDLLARLGALAGPATILASNTSYLDLDALAIASGRPEQVLGLHFFAPAQRMKLLELVEGRLTSRQTLLTGLAIAKKLGKQAVIAKVGDGFIGNRIFAKYRQHAEFLIEDGAAPEAVDAAAEALGFAMGPFAVADLSGLDIAWRNRQRLAATRDPRERYVRIADQLCEAGRLGRKSGAGWYDYPEGQSRGTPSSLVAKLVREAQDAVSGATPVLDTQAIGRRLLGAIVNEAALVVADGIARAAGDIDVAFVNGYGFSRFRGGPLFQAAQLTQSQRETMMDDVEMAAGFGFRRGDVEMVLAQLSQRDAIDERRN